MTIETFECVWDAIAADPAEAAQLKIVSALMLRLTDRLQALEWTETDAAVRLGVPEDVVRDLLEGRIDRFSIDSLVAMALKTGLRVELSIPDAA